MLGLTITLIVGIAAISIFALTEHKDELWEEIRKRMR
jgi:hypothetical protein